MTAGTLAQELQSAAVDFEQLERDYKPMLRLVRELIGVIPNCDPYLEIWPPGFRTYNLLVPNLLNLPAALINQGAPKDLLGLAMFSSSMAAGCMYCSAHTCSFALRRGMSAEALAGDLNPTEQAVSDLAGALGRVPSDVTAKHLHEAQRYLSPQDVEWLVLGTALMGFLNNFMDTMGIELEAESIANVQHIIGDAGWSTGKHQWTEEELLIEATAAPKDSIRTYLRVFRQGPRASRLESRWTRGVSGRAGPALLALEDEIGYSFPVLASLHHRRAIRAVATVLRDNLDPDQTVVGLPAKAMAGLVYAKTVGNEMLVAEMVQLSQLPHFEVDTDLMVAVGRFGETGADGLAVPPWLTSEEAATIILAKASSTSPATVNEITIETVTNRLSPAQIVEVVVWLSVLQMLHRLYIYYDARIGLR